MATKKYKKTEAKEITNVMLEDMLSPFKVQNWLARNFDAKTASGKTIREIFAEHGFTRKKVMLSDLFQFGEQTCVLEKVCKVAEFNAVDYWYNNIYSNNTFAPLESVPYGFFVLGNYIYRAVSAANNIYSFLLSLDAVNMFNDEREKRIELYTRMFDRIDRIKIKKAAKEAKAANKEAKKARNKAVHALMDAIKVIPLYATFTPLQLAKTALSMYNNKAA